MRRYNAFLILFFTILSYSVSGQSLSVEISGMDSYSSFSSSFGTPISKNEKLSYSLIGKYYTYYSDSNRLLALSNLGYTLTPNLKTTLGAMYIYGGTVKPTLGIQTTASKGGFSGMLAPSLTFGEQIEILLSSRVQYIKEISEKTQFVSRISVLGWLGFFEHVASKLSIRSGLSKGNLQYGLASDLSFKSNDFDFFPSIGLFLQYRLF